ncbi:unnamed protein product [Clavelina lepadiformis]|uniref:C2H2-type domain-containing protein n=1 Tax=Clavelina lepadiformis TaxID=159417 RepID=A0ABP0GJ22_CLALP
MDRQLVGMQVDILLKAISDMISQEFKSMRQDMKKEFVKLQESMEDVISMIKRTETMNNAMPVEETSQTTVVKSDISLNIEEVYSEKAPVFPLVEAVKQEPLLLEEHEVSQPDVDDLNISMSEEILPQSDIGVNATVKIVKPQNCVARNSDEESSDSVEMFLNKSTAIERMNECKVDGQLLVGKNKEKHFSCNFCDKSFKWKQTLKDHLRTHTEIKKTETMNNAMPVEESSQTTVVKSDISLNIEEVYSEKAPVFPLVEAIKEEPLLLEQYEVSQTGNDDRNISMLNKFLPQSDIGVNATVKIVKPQSCVARNSDEECSDSVEMFLNKSTAIERINACKVDGQLLVGKNKEKHFSCNFCDKSFKCKTKINKTSQALDVESDTGICIKEVYSENASVFPLVEAIKEEPLLLQHWEVSETDDPSISMSNMFSHQSKIGVNAAVKTVEPQTCIEDDHSEKASVYPQFDVIEEEPLLLQKYAVLQTETDDPNISILNKLTSQSEIGVKATVKTIDARNCIEKSSDEECSDSVEMFFDKSATNDRNNACKIQTQLFVGNNKEKHFFCKFCDKLLFGHMTK